MTANAVDKHRGLALVLYPYAMVATYLELDVVIEDSGIEAGQSGPVGFSQYLDQGSTLSSLACAVRGSPTGYGANFWAAVGCWAVFLPPRGASQGCLFGRHRIAPG